MSELPQRLLRARLQLMLREPYLAPAVARLPFVDATDRTGAVPWRRTGARVRHVDSACNGVRSVPGRGVYGDTPDVQGAGRHRSATAVRLDAAVERGRVPIQLRPGEVTITFQGGAPMVSPLDGQYVPWRREDGELFELSTRWDGPVLVQRIRAPEGAGPPATCFRIEGTP